MSVSDKNIVLGTREQIYMERMAPRVMKYAGGIGIAALIAAALLGLALHDSMKQFLCSYLTAWVFFFALAVSALWFVLAHHLFKAAWSNVVRRIGEAVSNNFILLAILFIPILLGMKVIFPWTSHAFMMSGSELRHKQLFLNTPFYILRMAIYLGVLAAISIYYRRMSLLQDQDGQVSRLMRLQKHSGWCFLVVCWIMNLIGVDLVMSLQPKWLTYAEPLYFATGCAVTFFAALPVITRCFQRQGFLPVVNKEHYHDMGKWLFAFVMFWAYIGFAQYILIWYGDVPKETAFFLFRQIGPWAAISIALIIGHFLIPFLGLISRWPKRRPGTLVFWGVWVLVFQYLDFFWQIQPAVYEQSQKVQSAPVSGLDPYKLLGSADKMVWMPLHPLPLLISLLCVVGVGGVFVAHTFYLLANKSLLPLRDPRLPEALAVESI